MKYWVNVVSKDHVLTGMDGGFTQANHGKPWALRKMKKGDKIVFYSPKTAFMNGQALQAFTAICEVIDDEPYQAEMNPDSHPWRRDVQVLAVRDVPIRPLLEKIDFVDDVRHWGFKFRFGVFEVGNADFGLILQEMTKEEECNNRKGGQQ